MITVRLSGGMGNQMFQYAAGRALSLRNNVPLALDLTYLNHRVKMPQFLRPNFAFRKYDLGVFNIHATIANKEDIKFWNRPFFGGKLMLVIDALLRKLAFLPGWEKSFSFDQRILSMGGDTYLAGFWQSEKYFKEYAEDIRRDFSLKEPLSYSQQLLKTEIENTESVCIHIRRGDKKGLSFYTTCDIPYYKRSVAYLLTKTKIEKFFIFSDDIEWCKENLQLGHPITFVDSSYSGTAGEGHIDLMSACKHFIIPNSTFSWWGAWLARNPHKIVIAPKKWFGGDKISVVDLMPEEWVKMEI